MRNPPTGWPVVGRLGDGLTDGLAGRAAVGDRLGEALVEGDADLDAECEGDGLAELDAVDDSLGEAVAEADFDLLLSLGCG
jgi:hypothetical protein